MIKFTYTTGCIFCTPVHHLPNHHESACMILEIAILTIYQGQNDAYEAAMREASPLIASSPGYISHSLQRCMEDPQRYVLLVQWQTLEDHTIGFRGSAAYQRWREITHPFYVPPAVVEHYIQVLPD